jgi:hypothetical protein
MSDPYDERSTDCAYDRDSARETEAEEKYAAAQRLLLAVENGYTTDPEDEDMFAACPLCGGYQRGAGCADPLCVYGKTVRGWVRRGV